MHCKAQNHSQHNALNWFERVDNHEYHNKGHHILFIFIKIKLCANITRLLNLSKIVKGLDFKFSMGKIT